MVKTILQNNSMKLHKIQVNVLKLSYEIKTKPCLYHHSHDIYQIPIWRILSYPIYSYLIYLYVHIVIYI